MRIDAYNAIANVYKSNSKIVSKTSSVAKTNDNLEISQAAKNYQVAKQAVSVAPDIRQDKIAEIKAKMEVGTYSVSPEAFAEKLLQDTKTIAF